MLKLIPILAIFLSGCSGYGYVGAGLGKNGNLNGSDEWDDGGSIGGRLKAGYRHQISGNWYGDFNFIHNSQPLVNHETESGSDHIYYDIEYRL